MYFPKREFVLMVAENMPAKKESIYSFIQRKVFLFDRIINDNFGKCSGYSFKMRSFCPYSEELQDDSDVWATIGLITGRRGENITDLGASYLHGNQAETRIMEVFNKNELKLLEELFCGYESKTEADILKDAVLAWANENQHNMNEAINYFLPFFENVTT